MSARLRTFEAALYKSAHYITLHYYTLYLLPNLMATDLLLLNFKSKSIANSSHISNMSRIHVALARLRNDLYCVERGVKLNSNQPTISRLAV